AGRGPAYRTLPAVPPARHTPGPAAYDGLAARPCELAAVQLLTLDPAVDHLVAFPRGDQRIAGPRAGVPHHVPEPLGIDDDLHAGMQPDPRLGGRIVLVFAQDEHRPAGSVVELQPGPDNPAAAVRVQPVVVIAVQL